MMTSASYPVIRLNTNKHVQPTDIPIENDPEERDRIPGIRNDSDKME
jgi:hypothetical protein